MGDGHSATAGITPARWASCGFVGGASIVGMLWALLGRAPAPVAPPAEPVTLIEPTVLDPARPGSYPALPGRRAAGEPGLATPVEPGPASAAGTTQERREHAARPIPAVTPDDAPRARPLGSGDRPPAATPLRLNINTATRAELELLPRIGPTLAQRIIDFREAEGPIGSLLRLQDVKGIGERTAERLEPYIRFE